MHNFLSGNSPKKEDIIFLNIKNKKNKKDKIPTPPVSDNISK